MKITSLNEVQPLRDVVASKLNKVLFRLMATPFETMSLASQMKIL